MARSPQTEQDLWTQWSERFKDTAAWLTALGLFVWETAGAARPQVYAACVTLLAYRLGGKIDVRRKKGTRTTGGD